MSKRSLCSCALLLWVGCLPAFGRQVLPQRNFDESAGRVDDTSVPGGVEVLSDTGGVDLGPYIKQIVAMIRKNWAPLIPLEAKPPQLQHGEAKIRFNILPDGRIGAMSLDGSTNDDSINLACWHAITSVGQFPPPPAGLQSRPLILRIHFSVNTSLHLATATSAQR